MNVRELYNQLADEAGSTHFFELSAELGAFSKKLNEIGGRNMETIPPETVPDIDATVELDEAEAGALIAEFRTLLAEVKKIA